MSRYPLVSAEPRPTGYPQAGATGGRWPVIDLVPAERTALAGLARFLDDPDVTEVMVNGGSEVWSSASTGSAGPGRSPPRR